MPKIAAPRGTADILPAQAVRWRELEVRVHETARRFGYGEIRTPVFEASELFARTVGEATDIVNKEMYIFEDRGGRSLSLRPEFTAPVVRALLEAQLLPGVQRVYYIGSFFRYERPQKGRMRQAHQFGVECFGYEAPEADVEVIGLALALIQSYDLDGVALRINSVGDGACRGAYRSELVAHFARHAAQLSEDSQRRLERNPLRILDSKDERDRAAIESAPSILDALCAECSAHFAAVRTLLDAQGIAYTVDPRIVRGLDYYTRTVFEFVADSLGAHNTICGGGRYDELVASLGGPTVPAVGFGLGMERFLLAAASDGEPERAGMQVIGLGERANRVGLQLAAEMRAIASAPTYVDYGDRKLLAQLKMADRNRARYAVILGDDELAAHNVVVRDLAERTDARVPLHAELAETARALVEWELRGRR